MYRGSESRLDHLARRMWTEVSPEDPINETERRQPDRSRRKRRKRSALYSPSEMSFVGFLDVHVHVGAAKAVSEKTRDK
ncbi:Hypothetical protein PHPALM_18037 [Phytophthora palmivora]|uniref:Uncharacterized protein n=1 Tax=Phytophthora palmivora TaxID=4796 RepID=A0A2P4XKR3_9STRA|nr:Hypothetical protein PHPALM_18037 [Phytophthora palmivora]